MESRSLWDSLEAFNAVRYGLARVLRSVKALQTREKSDNGFENLLLQVLASHFLKVNFFVVVVT